MKVCFGRFPQILTGSSLQKKLWDSTSGNIISMLLSEGFLYVLHLQTKLTYGDFSKKKVLSVHARLNCPIGSCRLMQPQYIKSTFAEV